MGKRDYCVYKHTTPDGKVYVGQTQQEPEARWGNGRLYKANPEFTLACEKYGWENIKHEILAENLTQKEAYEIEREYIRVLDATNPLHGYNILHGEQHKAIYCVETGEVFESLHEAARKTGIKRDILKSACIGEYAQAARKHWCFLENKDSFVIDESRKTAPENKPIINMDTGEIYSSCGEAAKKYGISNMTIRKVCQHKQNCYTAAGYRWAFLENYEADKTLSFQKRVKRIMNMQTGETFKSAREAERMTGISRTSVLKSCKTGKKIAGCSWRYIEG
nr:MAG TPA: intron associated endonuclease [Caudoviricetes sp.]